MKCTIPEISWHNRDPVLSVDIKPGSKNENFERVATGGTDSHVVIWHFEIQETGAVKVEFAADLQRHQKAVNVVRFSPSGEFLASADDESVIIIWKQKTDQDAPELSLGDSDNATKEQWLGIRVLRGHMEDVYDLSWSPDSSNLISGSVDNSAILWDVHKGRNLGLLKEHKGFVQGVAWDPRNQYVATLSSDRMCRVYNVNSKKLVSRVSKAQLPVPDSSNLHGKVVRLFHDDTLKSYFRRLCFSPDGQLLIVPSGIIENSDSDKNSYSTFIFTRRILNRPAVYLPSNGQYTVAVRCCPLLFELRDRESVFALPYRMILAVATQNSVLLYDTQQPEPFGVVSNIHYTRLTDLTWSGNGRMMVVSSTDGYCSIVTFAVGELGVVYEPKKDVTNQEKSDKETAGIEIIEESGNNGDTVISCKDTRVKIPEDIEIITDARESKSDDTLDTSESCVSNKTLDSLVKPLASEEVKVSSGPSSEGPENKIIPDLKKTPESFKTNFCGMTESLSNKKKTPRRIKPIMLSSPRKVLAKPLHSSDISGREREPSSVRTPRKKCPIKSSDHKSSETSDLGDISDSGALERISPSPSHCSPKERESVLKETSENITGNSSSSIKPLSVSEESLSNGKSSDNLTAEGNHIALVQDNSPTETIKTADSVEVMKTCDTEMEVASSNEPMQLETDPAASTVFTCAKPTDSAALLSKALPSVEPEPMEMDNSGSSVETSKFEPVEASTSAMSHASPLPSCVTPVQNKRTPRRVQLTTLSSPKSRKKLL